MGIRVRELFGLLWKPLGSRWAPATSAALALSFGCAALAMAAPARVLWWDASEELGGHGNEYRQEMSDFLTEFGGGVVFVSTYFDGSTPGGLAVELDTNSYDVIVLDVTRTNGIPTVFDDDDLAALVDFYATHKSLLLDGTLWIRSSTYGLPYSLFPGPNGAMGSLLANEIFQLASRGGGILIGTDHDSVQEDTNRALHAILPLASFSGSTTPSLDGQFNGQDLLGAVATASPFDVLTHWSAVVSEGVAPTGTFDDVFDDPVTLYSQVEVADAPGGGARLCYISSTWAPSGVVAEFDCNDNGILDSTDIENATSQDDNADGIPDECQPVCGDGQVDAPEECDDGNTEDHDGCSSTCKTSCETLPGRIATVHPGRLVKFLSRAETPFALPTGAISSGTLQVFDSAVDGAGNDLYQLTAGTWKGLGSPAGSGGWKYKGAGLLDDPCKVVLIKSKGIKAVCRGQAVSLAPPFLGDLGARLTVDAGGSEMTYAASFGGETLRNDAGGFKRREASQSEACAVVGACPAAFLADLLDDQTTDPSVWSSFTQGSGPTVAETAYGMLEITIPEGSTGDPAAGGFQSVCRLRGDYDIRVDYYLTTNAIPPPAPPPDLSWPAESGVRVAIGTEEGFTERVSLGPTADPGDLTQYDRTLPANQPLPHEVYVSHLGGSILAIHHSDDPDNVGWHEAGVLRQVRVGNTVTSYFDARGTWRALASTTVSAADVSVTLTAFAPSYAYHNSEHPDGLTTTVGFHNFRLQPGATCVCE